MDHSSPPLRCPPPNKTIAITSTPTKRKRNPKSPPKKKLQYYSTHEQLQNRAAVHRLTPCRTHTRHVHRYTLLPCWPQRKPNQPSARARARERERDRTLHSSTFSRSANAVNSRRNHRGIHGKGWYTIESPSLSVLGGGGERTNETGGTKRRVRAPSLKCFECHMRPCVLGGDANYWLPLRCAAWILDGSPWMGFWMRGGPQATRGESLPPKFG